MNNFDALRAEIAPYTTDRNTIEKVLIDHSIDGSETYTLSNKKAIAQASIQILTSFLSLKSEGEGSFSQSYDKAGLQSKIAALAESNGIVLSGTGTIISNGSNHW